MDLLGLELSDLEHHYRDRTRSLEEQEARK